MAKWFDQSNEIARLREENARLTKMVADLQSQLDSLNNSVVEVADPNALTAEEAELAQNSPIQAIKAYRERTGVSLTAAKQAIDAVRS